MRRLTCGADLIERSIRLLWQVSGYVVAQADGRDGNEAVVEGVEEVPVGLDDGKDGRRDEKHDDQYEAEDDEDVSQADVEEAERVTETRDQRRGQQRGDNHQTLDERREEDQSQRNPDHRIDDTEDLTAVRQRRHVTVACTSTSTTTHT